MSKGDFFILSLIQYTENVLWEVSMQKNDREQCYFSDVPRLSRGGKLLSLLLALSLFFTVLSFCLWEKDEEKGGALSASATWFADFVQEHEAVAVFLGWEEFPV